MTCLDFIVCTPRVPVKLAEVHKHNRVGISSRCCGDNAVKEIFSLVASSLAMKLGYTIMNHKKYTSMPLEAPVVSCRQKVQPSAGTLTPTVLGDFQFPFLQHYQKREATIRGARYAKQSICKANCTHSYHST
jgi:hypothetical protein